MMVYRIITWCFIVIVSVMPLATFSSQAFAATVTRFVALDASGNGSGTSWTNAADSLQDGLDLASDWLFLNPSDIVQVWVKAGVYKPTLRTDAGDPRSVTFKMANRTELYGGFAGGEDDLDDRDPVNNQTVLDGDLTGDDDEDDPFNTGLTDDNVYHVLTAMGSHESPIDNSAVLSGFIITRGNAIDDPNTVVNPEEEEQPCHSVTKALGGGALLLWASPRVEQCRFADNQARSGGGIAAHYECDPIVVKCDFDRNLAQPVNGGGMFIRCHSQATIVNCRFTRNKAGHVGGALAGRNDDIPDGLEIRVVNCLFVGNRGGSDNYEYGGAIRAGTNSAWEINNSTFVANSAAGGGAVAVGRDNPDAPERTVTMKNCVLWGNSATGTPNPNGTFSFTDVYGHQIALIGNGSGSMNIEHCDVSGSSTLPNCDIFVQCNSADTYNPSACSYGNPSDCYLLTLGDGVLDADPEFVTTPSPGTDTEWGTSDDIIGDLHLQDTSPCINVGLNSNVPQDAADVDGDANLSELTPIDLDGNARFCHQSMVDMGPYAAAPLCQADIAPEGGNGTVDVDDLLVVINGWGTCAALPDTCPGNITCGEAIPAVDVDDLLALINSWGDCTASASEPLPENIFDCFDFCDRYTGSNWEHCMNACIQTVCHYHPEECE